MSNSAKSPTRDDCVHAALGEGFQAERWRVDRIMALYAPTIAALEAADKRVQELEAERKRLQGWIDTKQSEYEERLTVVERKADGISEKLQAEIERLRGVIWRIQSQTESLPVAEFCAHSIGHRFGCAFLNNKTNACDCVGGGPMSAPTPTPKILCPDCGRDYDIHSTSHPCKNTSDQALAKWIAQALAETRRAALLDAAKVVCPACRLGNSHLVHYDFGWRHENSEGYHYECNAGDIQALLAQEQAQEEGGGR